MKRRDFLKIGVGTVVVGSTMGSDAVSKTAVEPTVDSVACQNWAVKFRSVTTSVAAETYETFYGDGQRNCNPKEFLAYLLSGTDLPPCVNVDSMESSSGYCGSMAVTFTGVLFASNARQHSPNRFAGYEHTGFCLSSPDSKSAMHLIFSEEVF